VRERLAGEEASQVCISPASADGGDHTLVVRGIDDNGDGAEVLCRGSNHTRPADVDLLDDVIRGCVVRRCCLAERVEVHRDEVDRVNPVLLERAHVRRLIAAREESTVHQGVQRLQAAVEDLGEAGHLRHLAHRDTRFTEGACRPPSRDDFPAEVDELARELHEASLVRDRDQGTAHRSQAPIARAISKASRGPADEEKLNIQPSPASVLSAARGAVIRFTVPSAARVMRPAASALTAIG
jgi:hypothetical protein